MFIFKNHFISLDNPKHGPIIQQDYKKKIVKQKSEKKNFNYFI